MKTATLLILATALSIVSGNAQYTNQSQKQSNMILEYSDGNGNYYKITRDSIIYKPITKEMSSSGLYDGGEPAQKSITKDGFEKVYDEFEIIFKETSIHIKNRMKTSGHLVIDRGRGNERKVIIKSSEEQKKLEKLLKSLLSD